jgi:hypothetical protein
LVGVFLSDSLLSAPAVLTERSFFLYSRPVWSTVLLSKEFDMEQYNGFTRSFGTMSHAKKDNTAALVVAALGLIIALVCGLAVLAPYIQAGVDLAMK